MCASFPASRETTSGTELRRILADRFAALGLPTPTAEVCEVMAPLYDRDPDAAFRYLVNLVAPRG